MWQKILTLEILLLFNIVGYSQTTWSRVYTLNAPSRGIAVKELNGGHFVIGIEYTSISSLPYRMLLLKIDSLGDSLVSKALCGSVTGDIEVGQNKNEVVIIGTASSCIPNIQSDIVYYRLDTMFNVLDTALFGNAGIDKGKRIINDYDSGYVMACYNTSYPDLIHIDHQGNQIWSMNYGLSGLNSIERNLEGGYFICGNAGGGFVDPMYVAKTDSMGNVIWHKTFYTNGLEEFRDVAQTLDSGIISLADNSTLYKISSSGDSIWKKQVYPGNQRILITSGNEIVLTGEGISGMSLVKIDTSANIIWSRYYPYFANPSPSNYSAGYDVIETSDGGFLLVGEIDSLGTKNLYIVKTDSLGQVTTGLSEINSSTQTRCYPQPFTEETIITFAAADGRPITGNRILEVFTGLGQKVREETISAFPYHFHRNRLPSGLYVYTITHPGEIPVTGKMVVE